MEMQLKAHTNAAPKNAKKSAVSVERVASPPPQLIDMRSSMQSQQYSQQYAHQQAQAMYGALGATNGARTSYSMVSAAHICDSFS